MPEAALADKVYDLIAKVSEEKGRTRAKLESQDQRIVGLEGRMGTLEKDNKTINENVSKVGGRTVKSVIALLTLAGILYAIFGSGAAV